MMKSEDVSLRDAKLRNTALRSASLRDTALLWFGACGWVSCCARLEAEAWLDAKGMVRGCAGLEGEMLWEELRYFEYSFWRSLLKFSIHLMALGMARAPRMDLGRMTYQTPWERVS